MSDDNLDIHVEEQEISSEEWQALMENMQELEVSSTTVKSNKRTKQDPVPVNLSAYLNKLQFASIKKLQNFGWKLMFIRRSDPNEIVTIMHYPKTGETALIEKDGTVNKSHDLSVRKPD